MVIPPPSNFWTMLVMKFKHLGSFVSMKAKAVDDGEVKNEPSIDWSFRSLDQSKSSIPSKLYSSVVVPWCINCLGILFRYTKKKDKKK